MYLYILNRPSLQDEIAHLEFLSLTGSRVNGGFAFSGNYVDKSRPAYIDTCIEVLFTDNTIEGLYSKIKALDYKKDNYRVRFINTGIHVEFSERKRIERTISDIFEGGPNLKNPDDEFIITFTGDLWCFGKFLWKSENRWLIYDKKPFTFCNSLPARMARALVNIASMGRKVNKLIDPCCGMGTVLLQAMDMGFDSYGCDINPLVVNDANENLKHFGFSPVIECRDAAEITGNFDVSVVDLPYGVLSKKGSDRYTEIIGNVRKLCTQAVILSGVDIVKTLNDSGFNVIESCIVHKGGLDRHIYLCR